MSLLIAFGAGLLMPLQLQGDVLKSGKRFFMVTAYYSPLPDQTFYLTGSYETDIRLNGNGTNGADATEVYSGMLAAPSKYPFGTKISLPGLGVGTVHDRGGAILAGRDYDRIDVWMGQGEAGLARALHFGKRLIEGEIVEATIPEVFDYTWLSTEIPSYIRNREKLNVSLSSTSASPISTVSIRDLQQGLRQFGYYDGAIDGVMNSDLHDAILTFQLDNNIVSSPFDAGAGSFGPKTQAKLEDKLEHFNIQIESEKRYLRDNLPLLQPGLGKKDTGDSVVHLQQMLQALGYYQGPVNGLYDQAMIDSVFAFQTTYHVVATGNDPGAGYFGSQTHKVLVAALGDRLATLENLPQEKQISLPATTPWPSFKTVMLTDSTPQPSVALHFELFGAS
ncbi:peptidoglycan-binding protein [Candidatus Peregrinibacteria bacterium]|nr:peptidoglycan-binding protein [Candidatus Peregrinibacteria bacterium]